MAYTVRRVRLPNGIEATEYEEEIGGSETQLVYDYLFDSGTRVTGFERDYWGRIEGLEVLKDLEKG